MTFIAGVVGRISEAEARNRVERMREAMRFRSHGNATMESLGCSQQPPCAVLTADNRYIDEPRGLALLVDGEIYAAPSQKNGLAADCFPALIEQFLRKGKDFPRAINGAYTAALWDRAGETLYLVRDHAGCRSLYYAPIEGGIVFASTAAAVIASGLVDPAINPESVDAYFGVKALSPPQTMFSHVFSLRPGHVLVWKNGTLHQHDYWRLHEIRADTQSTRAELCDALRNTIHDAVRIRQQAGGNFCALVSGGIDTSAVATLLTQLPETPRPLHGLSIAFDEMAYSDAGLQDCIVRTLGIDQRERILKPYEFADALTAASGFLDAPVNDAALAGMYAVFGMAKADGYTIVFDGEGPDELFPAGNTQGELGIAQLLRIPQPLRRAIFGLLATSLPLGNSTADRIRRMCARLALPDDERRLTWRPLYHTQARRQLLAPDYCTNIDPYAVGKGYLAQSGLHDPLNLYQFGLIKTFLADDLLYKNERMASAHNLMNRTPLVDYRLIELALRIPSAFQIVKPTPTTDGIKLLYKAALRGTVPDEILDRKKERGFSQPTQVWFRRPLKEFLHETILGRQAVSRGIFNAEFLRRLFDEHVSGKANHDPFLTSVLIFNLWLQAHEKRCQSIL